MQLHLGLTFGFVLIVGAIVIAGMRNAPARAALDHADAGRIALPTVALLPLCVIGIAAFLVEGAGIDWSAIYMRDVFQSEPFVGGLGLTLFTFFMALTRLFADPFVDRFGSRTVALTLLLVSAVGLCAVWLAPYQYIALVGFALMGGGCSVVYPLAVSAAARRWTEPPTSMSRHWARCRLSCSSSLHRSSGLWRSTLVSGRRTLYVCQSYFPL